MTKERNPYIDIVKAVAIIFVVLGHSIQYGSGQAFISSYSFFDNIIFKIIYSFHMPLFMIISGYLFAFSVPEEKSIASAKLIIMKKIKQLIIPLLSWSFVSLVITIVKLIIKGDIKEICFIWIIKQLLTNFILGPWFLWALWWCSFIVSIVHFFLNDNPYIYILGFILTFVIPDSLGLMYYKYMYPYFILSYWFNSNNINKKWQKLYLNKYCIIGIIAGYLLLFSFYNRNIYIYISGYTVLGKVILQQIWIDCFRFVIGLFGSWSILYIIYFVSKFCRTYPRLLVYIGNNTLGIYLISGILFTEVLTRLTVDIEGLNYFLILLESCIVLVISLLINYFIKKITFLNKLFLGGR